MAEITVIMPVYNVGIYLEKCLDSIINQTFKDFEVICLNDGSTDNSLEILKQFKKSQRKICTDKARTRPYNLYGTFTGKKDILFKLLYFDEWFN